MMKHLGRSPRIAPRSARHAHRAPTHASMSDVWLGEQLSASRKAFVVEKLDEREAPLWREEHHRARLGLTHGAIAQVADFGIDGDGDAFVLVEDVRGEPLCDYADRHRLTLAQRLELFAEVCEAVEYAHDVEIVHGRLEADAVHVSSEGGCLTPKILGYHRAGIGTLADDVRALGVILHRLLVGAPLVENQPFLPPSRRLERDDVEAQQIARARRTRPSAMVRALRGELDRILENALGMNGSGYESCEDLRRAVAAHLSVVAPSSRNGRRRSGWNRLVGRFLRLVGAR